MGRAKRLPHGDDVRKILSALVIAGLLGIGAVHVQAASNTTSAHKKHPKKVKYVKPGKYKVHKFKVKKLKKKRQTYQIRPAAASQAPPSRPAQGPGQGKASE